MNPHVIWSLSTDRACIQAQVEGGREGKRKGGREEVRKKITESKENLRDALRGDPVQLGSCTVTTKWQKTQPFLSSSKRQNPTYYIKNHLTLWFIQEHSFYFWFTMKPCAPKGVRVDRGSKTQQIKALHLLTTLKIWLWSPERQPKSHRLSTDFSNTRPPTHRQNFKNMVVGKWL